jgi:hypothetical protein
VENLAPTGIRSLEPQARSSRSLYRLSYTGSCLKYSNSFNADETICSGHIKKYRVFGQTFPGGAKNRSTFKASGNIYSKPTRTILWNFNPH